MKKIIAFIAILSLTLFGMQGAFAKGGKPAEGIKVGTLLSYTGVLKEFGPAIKNGAVLAATHLSKELEVGPV